MSIMHDNACNFNKKTEFQNIVTKTKKYIEKKIKIKIKDDHSKIEYIALITIIFYNIFMILKKRRMQK